MYKLTQSDCIYRLSDGAWIPNDPLNAARQDYNAWVAAGNTPVAADSPVVKPKKASLDKLIDLLVTSGKITQADADSLK